MLMDRLNSPLCCVKILSSSTLKAAASWNSVYGGRRLKYKEILIIVLNQRFLVFTSIARLE